jgi:hypothetical protein
MVSKMIIDATTPISPDNRGDYGQELDTPQRTDVWLDCPSSDFLGLKAA